MKREDLERREEELMDEVVHRRKLGGYSTDATAILLLCVILMEIVRHLKEKMPRTRVKDDG